MTTQCKEFDDQLLDYLYEELPEAERKRFEAHLEGCARCRGEVAALGRVRSAAKSLEAAEPPSQVSAKLLFQAAQLAPRGRVIPLFKRVFRSPAYAMAASFLVVGSLVSFLFVHQARMLAPESAKAVAPSSPSPVGGEGEPPGVVAAAKTAPAAETLAPGGAPAAAARAERSEHANPAGLDLDSTGGKGRPALVPLAAGTRVDRATGSVSGRMAALPKTVAPEAPKEKDLRWQAKSDGDKVLEVQKMPAEPERPAPRAREEPAPVAHAKKEAVSAGPVGAAQALNDPSSGAGAVGGAAPPASSFGLATPSPASSPPPPAPSRKPSAPAPTVAPAAAESAADDAKQAFDEYNARDQRRGAADNGLQQQGYGRGKAKAAPALGAPPAGAPRQAQAADAVELSRGDRAEAPPVRTLDTASSVEECRKADLDYRQMQEHFPEQLTPARKLQHAKCLRLLGRGGSARAELDQLRVEAPAFAAKIDAELRKIQLDEPSQSPAVDGAVAPRAPAKKAAKRAQPADAKPAF